MLFTYFDSKKPSNNWKYLDVVKNRTELEWVA